MSSRVRTGGTCISFARFTRYVAQWDQYRRTRSRTGPPNSSYTGTPSARALTSSSAFSMAPIACWITPPRRLAAQRVHQRHVRFPRARVLADEARPQLVDHPRQAGAAEVLVVLAPAGDPLVGRDLEEVEVAPARIGVQGLDLS